MKRIVYLDESGDLGWNFTAPYRKGGSSRYLTVSSLCVPAEKSHIPKRVIKDLYLKFGWPTTQEKKWVSMDAAARAAFATAAYNMCSAHPDIHLHLMTVKKENVAEHIRKDPNKLYNYMIRLSILDCMAAQESVIMVPDLRSIKVKSGNSLPDYLQIELWFTKRVETVISSYPVDSQNSRGVQFADMLAGLVQNRFEEKFFGHIRLCARYLRLKRLFFGA